MIFYTYMPILLFHSLNCLKNKIKRWGADQRYDNDLYGSYALDLITYIVFFPSYIQGILYLPTLYFPQLYKGHIISRNNSFITFIKQYLNIIKLLFIVYFVNWVIPRWRSVKLNLLLPIRSIGSHIPVIHQWWSGGNCTFCFFIMYVFISETVTEHVFIMS